VQQDTCRFLSWAIASLRFVNSRDRPPNGAERFTSVYRAPSEIRDIAKGSRDSQENLFRPEMKVHATLRGSGNPLGAWLQTSAVSDASGRNLGSFRRLV